MLSTSRKNAIEHYFSAVLVVVLQILVYGLYLQLLVDETVSKSIMKLYIMSNSLAAIQMLLWRTYSDHNKLRDADVSVGQDACTTTV